MYLYSDESVPTCTPYFWPSQALCGCIFCGPTRTVTLSSFDFLVLVTICDLTKVRQTLTASQTHQNAYVVEGGWRRGCDWLTVIKANVPPGKSGLWCVCSPQVAPHRGGCRKRLVLFLWAEAGNKQTLSAHYTSHKHGIAENRIEGLYKSQIGENYIITKKMVWNEKENSNNYKEFKIQGSIYWVRMDKNCSCKMFVCKHLFKMNNVEDLKYKSNLDKDAGCAS